MCCAKTGERQSETEGDANEVFSDGRNPEPLPGFGRRKTITAASDGTGALTNNAGGIAMSDLLFDKLPDTFKNIQTRLMFVMRLEVKPPLAIGPVSPEGYRRIGVIPGGSFEGDRFSGKVLDGGSDWQTVRHDGAVILNVRLVLRTNDDALICMTYSGVRHGPPDIIAKIDRGEVVDPASYYFRVNPVFQTAAPQYDWVNRVVGIGVGHRFADGPIYSIFELL
jgi:hypothetical protein